MGDAECHCHYRPRDIGQRFARVDGEAGDSQSVAVTVVAKFKTTPNGGHYRSTLADG